MCRCQPAHRKKVAIVCMYGYVMTSRIFHVAMQCDWPETEENARRRSFCSRYEGYGALCHCSNPTPLHLHPPPVSWSSPTSSWCDCSLSLSHTHTHPLHSYWITRWRESQSPSSLATDHCTCSSEPSCHNCTTSSPPTLSPHSSLLPSHPLPSSISPQDGAAAAGHPGSQHFNHCHIH